MKTFLGRDVLSYEGQKQVTSSDKNKCYLQGIIDALNGVWVAPVGWSQENVALWTEGNLAVRNAHRLGVS